jgi:hypothetical protein|nr:MAG TPA: hypothetical protein [Caudoviricetes sp.]
MKVETKFSTNQKVYFMHENRIKSGEIAVIDIHLVAYDNSINITYKIFNYQNNAFNESELFSNKEELLDYLANN